MYYAFKATTAKDDPDSPTYWQVMSDDNVKYLFQAMNEEIGNVVIEHNIWEAAMKSDVGKIFSFGKIIQTT
eukprot:2014982-Ditylum_brightwellii.AAC.1